MRVAPEKPLLRMLVVLNRSAVSNFVLIQRMAYKMLAKRLIKRLRNGL